MTTERATSWPRRSRMPNLARLDAPTQAVVRAAVERLRESVERWLERFLEVARTVPGYDVLPDDEIRQGARAIIEGEIAELESLRVPDDALRAQLQGLALRRASQGMSMETLARGYQLGSRELLVLMDEIAAAVDMPPDLLLAIHDSTWEFANEASAVFADVQHELTLERARFDAERRSGFARAVLDGSLPSEQLQRDAALFGLDPQATYTPLAVSGSGADADAVRRAVAAALRVPPGRLLFAEVGGVLGCIAPAAPAGIDVHLVAVGASSHLGDLRTGFDEAAVALETAHAFGMAGVVTSDDLGPRTLALATPHPSGARVAGIEAALADAPDVTETARTYLAHDQRADDAGAVLRVHPNTVRYRLGRFRALTGLDLRRTEDLVLAWWVLNRPRR
jgi:hypothetical protein